MITSFADRPLWHQTAVNQFLSDVNWDGLSPEKRSSDRDSMVRPEDSSRVDPNAPLPMTLSVSQFLTSVNWDGAILMAVPMMTKSAVMEVNDGVDKTSGFTLNDFSDLF
jgi:hypothetical protein